MAPSMTPRRALVLGLVSAIFGIALVAVPPLAPPTAQAASYARPTGLKATVSARAIALTWKAVKKAPAYRVQFSTIPSMKTFTTKDVVGNYLEWTHLDSTPSANSARLRPNTKYYLRVKVITLDKRNLTSYSKILTVRTAKSNKLPELPPVSLRATKQSSTSMYLSWSSRGPGVRYRIRYGTTPKLEMGGKSRLAASTAPGTVLKGLKAGTKYYYKVRTMSADGRYLSDYSKTSSFTTSTSPGSPAIKIATYNVCSAECDTRGRPWEGAREAAVVANLAAQAPDVIALQEMHRAKLTAFLADLNQATGRTYVTTDPASKNVSGTTRLAYDSERFTTAKDEHGTLSLSLGLSSTRKYAVWAILTDALNGRRLFVVANHLIAGSAYQGLRKTQAAEIVALIAAKNTGKLPVVVAGDFNSNRDAKPSNVIYDVLAGAGYREPLGNTQGSWTVAASATAEHRMDLDYSTFNGFETYARRSKYANAPAIDYIWHSANVRVAQCQVVVDVDTKRKFVGVIPSDHNLLTATIHLR